MKHNTVLIFLYLCLLNSCLISNDPKCEKKTYVDNLPSYYLEDIPYKGFDTLVFVNKQDSEIIAFIGTGIDSGYNLSSFNDNYDCPDNPLKLEYRNYIFKSANTNEAIELKLYMDKKDGGMIAFSLNGQLFYGGLNIIGSKYTYTSYIIENKTYINLNRIGNDKDLLDTSYYVLYNKEFGIVQFKFPNGNYWNLLEKK